jgi:hypothetical protein
MLSAVLVLAAALALVVGQGIAPHTAPSASAPAASATDDIVGGGPV